ncbi:hypothetical protein Tco_0783102 [Tanacetum coccineum]
MRTRNSNFPNNSNVTIPRRQNRGRAPNIVEPELRTIVEVAPMAERTMEELLRAPTEGYGEAIVLPEINADHFEIKMNLLQLVQANPFHRYERENPHAHINSFKRITSRNTTSKESVSKTDERIDKLADQLSTLVQIVSKKVATPAPVKAVEENCVTLDSFTPCLNFGTLPSNTIPNPKGEMKVITTRSGVAYEGPSIPTNPTPKKEPDVPKTLPKTNIPYPSRHYDQKFREKASYQKEKIFQIFQDLRFDISFADALFFMPRFAPTIRNLLLKSGKLLS